MPRYRLRYQGSDLEMPPGEFVVGRSSACNLALDDALVSRRHASIHVTADGASVEDLGSRNGVSVNGERVEGRRKLGHLDRVMIGSHELLVVEIPDRTPLSIPCESCGAAMSPDDLACQTCGHRVSRGSPTLAGMTLELPVAKLEALRNAKAAEVKSANEDATRRALLTGIADKALALGRFDEAERVLGKGLQEILARAKGGQIPEPARLQEATKYALKLADGTKRAMWLDWVFELHEAAGKLMSAEDIERLHELVRKLRYHGGAMRRYLDSIRARTAELGPADRFLLSRLESLERMVSA